VVVDFKLEVVVIPVADVDRAKNFYKALGWREDADFAREDFRVVQLTPPGSPCSVIFGTGLTSAAPGSTQGLQLVVDDIDAAQAELAGHGAAVSEVFHDAGGHRPRPGPQDLRLVHLLQRPGRQRMVRPRDHHAPPGPVTT
jgi:catechol 2,3-dioxygenase-like lactoylglutathione lyase family enzyme